MGRALKYKLLRKQSTIRRTRAWQRWNPIAATAYEWASAFARCVGSDHLQSGAPCQDWAMSRKFDNGDIAIALADGAGSSRFSHYGSSLTANRVSRLISEHFEEAFGSYEARQVFKQRLVSQLQIDLYELSKLGIDLPDDEREKHSKPSRADLLLVPCELSDLSCTVLCVVVRGGRYIAFHVGDGVIGAEISRKGRARLKVLSKPDNGEFANETCFVTSRKAASTARLITGRISTARTLVTGFVLMSDGPEAALYNKRESQLVSACSKLLSACRVTEQSTMHAQLEKTLVNVIAKKTSDDCSLAMMALRSEHEK